MISATNQSSAIVTSLTSWPRWQGGADGRRLGLDDLHGCQRMGLVIGTSGPAIIATLGFRRRYINCADASAVSRQRSDQL
jgi:hypothetical protein